MKKDDLKTFTIILLILVVFYLFSVIIAGSMCHCSTIHCKETYPLRSYLS